MADTSEADDSAVAADADDIATKITQFLFEGFRAKTGRNPDNNEIEQLFDELTPERVAELLGEVNVPANEASGSSDDEDEDDEDEGVDSEAEECDSVVPREASVTVETENRTKSENHTELAAPEDSGENEKKRTSPDDNLVAVDDADSHNIEKRVRQ